MCACCPSRPAPCVPACVPPPAKTLLRPSTEMAKAGLIDEMMNDALDSALDNEDIEEETDAEVEKVCG